MIYLKVFHLKESMKISEVGKSILEGMDKTTYEAEIENQIKELKSYISLCHGKFTRERWHPLLATDVLNFKNKFTKVNEHHMHDSVIGQSNEFASLGSCYYYFEMIYFTKRDVFQIIKSVLNH